MGRNTRRYHVAYNEENDEPNNIPAINAVSGEQVFDKSGDDDVIIIKGPNGSNGYGVNLTSLKKILKDLRTKADIKTEDLSGTDEDNFRYVVDLANVLYQSGGYLCVYKAINEIFASVHKPVPNTVGAYFVGCHTQNLSFKGNNGCSAVCAGSFKPPAGHSEFKVCEHLVVLIDNNTGEIKQLNDPEDKSKAFIHVTGCKNFKLSTEQADKLKSLGVKKVKIYAYDLDHSQYTALTNGFIELGCGSSDNSSDDACSSEKSNNLIVFIFFILIIVIIVAIAWLVLSGKHNGYYDTYSKWLQDKGLDSSLQQ